MRFRPEQHLRRPGDFRRVRESGRRVSGNLFTFWWLVSAEPAAPPLRRLGVVASKAAVSSAAVARNRAKRRLREVFRRHQDLLPVGGDLIIVARAALNRAAFAAVETEFARACRQLAPVVHD